VNLRGGFSDRMGVKKVNTQIQLTELDDRTRTAFVNTISFFWQTALEDNDYMRGYANNKINSILICILSNLYNQQVNYSTSYNHDYIFDIVYNSIKKDDYHDVLTVIEYIAALISNAIKSKSGLYVIFNNVFEKEFVGYRFINEKITPISDEIEVAEIETASNSPYNQVNNHLNKSLEMLSNRDNPDYENSIKESISAVESICSIIIGEKTTLGDALKKLESAGLSIHPALKEAFNKLYGYTSDGAGIRHAGQLGGSQSTFEEAKFMLVSCCAFVNYLIGVMGKHKI